MRETIRLYADSAIALSGAAAGAPVALTLAPHATGMARFTFDASPWPLGDGFFPLAAIVAEVGGNVWTREAGLPVPLPPVMR